MANLLDQTATQIAGALRRGETTASEVIAKSLEKISETNETYNAFISVDAEHALTRAAELDAIKNPAHRGALHGVPIAIKDVTDVKGMVTTQGSLLAGKDPAERDDVTVARLQEAGAVIVGKTNTPEFGFGAVCTNRICGPTRNPWDTRLTSGGSSGGSAVAVATGMVALAQGVDFGGSVRTPAAFTGTVGLRPTPGVIPEATRPLAWNTLATQGILARTVADAELMMNVMAGPHPHDPSSQSARLEETPHDRPIRIASSVTMNGAFPVDPEVRDRFVEAEMAVSKALGPIRSDSPSVEGASEAFKVLRAAQSWASFGKIVEERAEELTPSFVWNVRQGRDISAERYLGAEKVRSKVYREFQDFFTRYDVLMLPAASVMPFPNEQGEVTSIDGKACESIIDYLACTYLVSFVGFPTIVLPAPSQEGSLPFGVQLVARPHHEKLLLRAASLFEKEGNFRHRWAPHVPVDRRSPTT